MLPQFSGSSHVHLSNYAIGWRNFNKKITISVIRTKICVLFGFGCFDDDEDLFEDAFADVQE
jgi:hypothetical protein